MTQSGTDLGTSGHRPQTPEQDSLLGVAGRGPGLPDRAAAAPASHPSPAVLGPVGWARWGWRTLTSMRTALLLLAMLGLAAVPGSLLPQRGVNPGAVAMFTRENPELAPWLERFSLFEVYSSAWFAAVYLLLLTSLTGCVLPRCARLLRSIRSQPGPAPPNLTRLDGAGQWTSARTPAEALEAAANELRRRRFRVRVDGAAVSAEKGHLREVGNLAFHLSLLLLLFGIAGGALYGFEGRVVVVDGAGFSNVRSQYDDFIPGPWTDQTRLEPFSLRLVDFSARFETRGPQRGSPRAFTADVRYRASPAARPRQRIIRVNHPLNVNGTKVFLTGHGYAPRVTVRDGTGRVVFSGPVVFLPRDGSFISNGVVKAPDARPSQLGFEGFLLPTAAVGPQGPYSAFPGLLNPRVFLTAYTGDLGLSAGAPQSVYKLDKSKLTQVRDRGQPFAQALAVGQTMTLPGGQGTLTFDGVSRFANFQIARDPGKGLALAAAVMLLLGLLASLSVRQRRVFVRARPQEDGTGSLVEIAHLARTRFGVPAAEQRDIAHALGLGAASHPLPDSSADVPSPTAGRT